MSIFNLSTLSDLYQSFPRIERFGWQGIYPFLLLDMNEPNSSTSPPKEKHLPFADK